MDPTLRRAASEAADGVRRPALVAIVCPLVLAMALTACGTSATSATTDTSAAASATDAATYVLVSPAAVAKGLAAIRPLLQRAATLAPAGGARADAAVTAVYDEWYRFEGSIRKNDNARYLDMEDALVQVKSGVQRRDGAKARGGAAAFDKLADAYLAEFPAGSTQATTSASPLGAPVAKSANVAVQLADYAIVVPPKLGVGRHTFTMTNVGKETHEFIVVRTDLDAASLPTDAEGRFVEDAAGLRAIDEKEGIKAGTTAMLTVDLPAGNYVFACNLLGHYKKGMAVKVRVG